MIGHAEVFCCKAWHRSYVLISWLMQRNQVTGNANLAIGVMVVVFVVGLTFFIKSVNVYGDGGAIRAQQPISGI